MAKNLSLKPSSIYSYNSDKGQWVPFTNEPYLIQIAEGDIPQHTPMTKMGVNGDIDDAVEDIWEVGGTYTFPTTAMQMEVVSSSAQDDLDVGGGTPGTGIHKVDIHYLTNTFVEKNEVVTLNGTGVVATTATDIYRVNYFEASVVGSGGSAAGNISLRHLSDTPVYAQISTGYTRSRQAIYTVPANKTLYIYQVNFGAISASTNGCRFITRAKYDALGGVPTNFFMPYSEIGVENGSFSLNLDIPTKFISGVDLKISGVGTNVAANIVATATIRGWLE